MSRCVSSGERGRGQSFQREECWHGGTTRLKACLSQIVFKKRLGQVVYFENKTFYKMIACQDAGGRTRVKMTWYILYCYASYNLSSLHSESLKTLKSLSSLPLFHRNEARGAQRSLSSSDEWFIHQKHLMLAHDDLPRRIVCESIGMVCGLSRHKNLWLPGPVDRSGFFVGGQRRENTGGV